MANVMIDIAAEFTGNKAFKQADSSTDKLTKNVKKLAGAFGLAFSATAVLAYGKAAVKAAAEDEKAQKQLALALKNVGLGRDAASSEDYIQRLQTEFGILDDKLRPAYQTLAVATQNTNEAQRLLNLSLDISAATGKDLASVTGALSRAYLGNNAALSRLGVGISKADLKAGKFEDIISQLEGTFKGAATEAANTFQGSIDKLAVASANASEIIGTGLIDALKGLGDQDSVDNLATAMQNTAIYIADVIRGIGVLTEKLKGLPGVSGLNLGMIPIVGSYLEILRGMGRVAAGSGINAQGLAHLAELQSIYAARTLKTKTKLTTEEVKALRAARLKAAIDKANLALLKGEEVFDMDKIQVAAALTNQAEQLGKATNASQVLQIANDTARLNIKKSISHLEDAIASKDEAAIVAATKRLNEDLKIFTALSNQNVKLADIKSILDSLKPKDLINLGNLDAAIAKMIELNKLQGSKTGTTPTPTPTAAAAAAAAAANEPSVYTIPKGTTDFTTANPDIFNLLNKTVRLTSDTVQDQFFKALNSISDLPSAVRGANYQARAEQEYAMFLSQINLGGIAGQSVTSGMAQGLPLSNALSGGRYAAQGAAAYGAGATIVNNFGVVGDPNSAAEVVANVIREAIDRGTLTAL